MKNQEMKDIEADRVRIKPGIDEVWVQTLDDVLKRLGNKKVKSITEGFCVDENGDGYIYVKLKLENGSNITAYLKIGKDYFIL